MQKATSTDAKAAGMSKTDILNSVDMVHKFTTKLCITMLYFSRFLRHATKNNEDRGGITNHSRLQHHR